MYTNNAYLSHFESNFFLCINCLCNNCYFCLLCLFSCNFCIYFEFNFQLEAFNYKQINALFSIALLRCIIMNFLVLALLFNLISYIVLHDYFVNLIHFFSNIE